jgi:response regulator NasT
MTSTCGGSGEGRAESVLLAGKSILYEWGTFRSREGIPGPSLAAVSLLLLLQEIPVPGSSLRILIGEDESVTALGLEQDLRSLGHTVVGIAGDGASAVAMARTMGPDLVLLDVRMPHLDGLAAAQQIHEERPVPIIAVTAYSDPDTVTQATRAPIFHYLVKPVTAAQLDAAIQVAFARHEDWLSSQRESDDLRRKLDDRKVIERAKGILMERENITESAAYRILQRTSQSRNMSMADLARSLLAAEELIRPAPARAERPSRGARAHRQEG